MLIVNLTPINIQIIGTQVACQEGFKDSWRETAAWVAKQLNVNYNGLILVKYYDLFDQDCPSLPANSQLPVVIVDGQVLSNGEKLSVPKIRKKLSELGLRTK